MSKAFDDFDFTPEPMPSFWRPFILSMLFAAPVSLLWYYIATRNGLRLPFASLLVGALCALGTRIGNGEYSSTLLSATIQIFVSIMLIALHQMAEDSGQSLLQTAAQVCFQGHISDFFNEAFWKSGQTGIRTIPFALYIAYKIQDRN